MPDWAEYCPNVGRSGLRFGSVYFRAVQYSLSCIYRCKAEEEHRMKPLAKPFYNANCSRGEAAHSLY